MSKIKYWDRLKDQIERGKQGLNTGIPFYGFTTLSDYIMNIQQGRYDLVFANTGVGKSAFVNNTYVFGAINFLEANPNYIHDLEIISYSLEIKPEDQIAKYLASLIWQDYGILTDINEIKSKGNNKIRPEIEELIDSYSEKLEKLQSKYIFYRNSLTPDFLWKDIMGYAESRGTVIRDQDNNPIDYIPNNPNLITLIIIDHIGLIGLNDKYPTLKDGIDKISKRLITFKNIFNFSPVVISQINRSSEGMDRRDNNNWMPLRSDIKNTANLSEDAETIIGLANPWDLGIDKCLGYDINKYKDRYRLAKIVKNRDGKSNLTSSFLFVGEYGGFYQLPSDSKELNGKPPEELKRINEYYAKRKI